jgi:hypothetical protein
MRKNSQLTTSERLGHVARKFIFILLHSHFIHPYHMPSIAERQLSLLTAKGVAEAQALSAADGNTDSVDYKRQMKKVLQIYKQGCKALRAEAREDKEPTAKAQALRNLDLTNQDYTKRYVFDTLEAAQTALRALDTDANWATGKSGRHGGNKTRQHHGGPRGCFMITTDKTTKIATLWAADSNSQDLPEDMDGAREVDDEDSMSEDEHENESALAVLIASAGKSLAEIREMGEAARKAHAAKCNHDRSIRATEVTSLAEKMGCPQDENTKAKRLAWMLQSLE